MSYNVDQRDVGKHTSHYEVQQFSVNLVNREWLQKYILNIAIQFDQNILRVAQANLVINCLHKLSLLIMFDCLGV